MHQITLLSPLGIPFSTVHRKFHAVRASFFTFGREALLQSYDTELSLFFKSKKQGFMRKIASFLVGAILVSGSLQAQQVIMKKIYLISGFQAA